MRQDFKISYSRISAYLFCPYKYKLMYFDNMYIPINANIAFGHIVHKTLEQFHSGKEQNYDFLFECYDDAWRSDGFVTPCQVFEYYKRGKQMLESYYKTFNDLDAEILYVEKAFETNIGKYRFIGIIDRIDRRCEDKYEVMDYKTHAKIWPQETADKNLQLTFYAYACKNILGVYPDRISVYFLSENRKIYTKRTQNEISQAIDLAVETAESITAENFNPNTTRCFTCDFRLKCKYSKNKVEN